MKIQVLTNLYPLPWQPNRATFNKQQFELLAKTHTVEVLVLVSFIDWFRYRNSIHANVNAETKNLGISYLPYFYIPGTARFTYAFSQFLSLISSLRRIKTFRPDCLLLSWAYPDAVAGVALAKALNIPALIKVHGSDINVHGEYKLRAKQILWAANYARAVVSVSQNLKFKLTKLGVPDCKVHVVYNGINHRVFHPRDRFQARNTIGTELNREMILFVGNLKLEKGCIDLLQAFRELARRNNLVDLYYIGDGPERSRIEEIVSTNGLQSRVKLIGTVSHYEIASWYNGADLVALPSHNEGVPNVLLEAMACGTPIVATRVGGIPEIVNEESGILVEKESQEELEKALKISLKRKWDKFRISASVRSFAWENNQRELGKLLERVSGQY